MTTFMLLLIYCVSPSQKKKYNFTGTRNPVENVRICGAWNGNYVSGIGLIL